MPKLLVVFLISLFSVFNAFSQKAVVTKVYHGDSWVCNYFYTTFEDYVLELCNDSTSQLSVYRSTTGDIKFPSAITFGGVYSVNANTIKITYLNQNTVFEKSFYQGSTFIKKNIPSLFLPCTFVATDSTIKSTENLIPTLFISSISVATRFKSDFSIRLKKVFPLFQQMTFDRFAQID